MGNAHHKIIIADTQYLVVEALNSMFKEENGFLVQTADTYSALMQILDMETDVLITDFTILDYDGFDDLEMIKNKFPKLAILILTNSLTKSEFSEFSKIGIKNILYKTAPGEEILAGVDAAIKKRKYYSEEILDLIIEPVENKPLAKDTAHLTGSEIEIVRLIAEGLTTKEIALRKSISFHTVTTHRKNIFRKLNVSNTSELIMQAIKAGWIDNIEYYI